VDRLADRPGLCKVGRHAVVASHFPHFGEEDCLRGWNGSGTIFFSGCNLRCVFCQNHDISWQLQGERAGPARLAAMMLELQARGCHNINWVTPEHVVPQILEALPPAIEGGLRLLTVYNTSSYDSLESLELMDGVVDVYMPDFKLWTSERSRRYLAKRDYPEVARQAVREMHRQVGDLVFDERGLARRGLLVRHLVMPGMVDETEAILRFIAEELGSGTYVDVMAQYYPAGRTSEFPEIDRHPHRSEVEGALELADQLGLRRLEDQRVKAQASRLAEAGR
jgi:putative pyruvate formate lyase activating enzyme